MIESIVGSPLARLRNAFDRDSPERAVNALLMAAVVLSVLLAGSVVAWKRHQQAAQHALLGEPSRSGPPSLAEIPQVVFFTAASCAPCAELLIALRAVAWKAHGLQLLVVDTAADGAQMQRDSLNWVSHATEAQQASLPALFTRDGAFFDAASIQQWLRTLADEHP